MFHANENENKMNTPTEHANPFIIEYQYFCLFLMKKRFDVKRIKLSVSSRPNCMTIKGD